MTPDNTLAEVREALEIGLNRCEATQKTYKSSALLSPSLDEQIQQIKQALAKLDAMIDAQGWQPIETAPRDGTVILAFFPIGKGKRLYGNTRMVNFDYQSWRIYPGQSVIKSHPTHWMPLPKPPTQGDGG